MSTQALLSLVYDDAKRRGARGETGFTEWADRASAASFLDLSGTLGRFLPPLESLDALRRAPHRLRRLEEAVVERCRKTSNPASGGDGYLFGEYTRHLDRLRAPRRAPAAKDRADAARGDASGSSSVAWRYTEATVDRHGVTRVGATGWRAKQRTDSFSHYRDIIDPRNWSHNFNECFQSSYQIEGTGIRNPYRDPPADPPHPKTGQPWTGCLYECARLEVLPGDNLTQFRDVLNIDVSVDEVTAPTRSSLSPYERDHLRAAKLGGAKGVERVTLDYSLNRCLTSMVAGVETAGGLDIDSGKGGIAIIEGETGSSIVTAEALKGIRFSAATPFAESLNVLAFPFLLLWIPGLIIGALESTPTRTPRRSR